MVNEQTAVAVMPAGFPSMRLVMMLTAPAKCRIPNLNSSGLTIGDSNNLLHSMCQLSRLGTMLRTDA